MSRFILYLLPFVLLFAVNAYWLWAGQGSAKAFPTGDLRALIPYGIFLFTFATLIYAVKRLLHRKPRTT